jgi:SAM-dependent methyltransferase
MSGYEPQAEPPPSLEGLVSTLRAVAEPTRLRLALLLTTAELTVTEICQIVGQSQPRTSRHLRLLLDAGILERVPEGAHVFYRVADGGEGAQLARALADRAPAGDPVFDADTAALERVLDTRLRAAAGYLRTHADEQATLRPLHVADSDVEHSMLELIGAREPIERLLDIGTGSGRILELLAPVSARSIGLDVSRDMVTLARAKLGQARLSRASVRQGDLHRPPFEASSFDVAVMHHVLHLLDDPGEAIADAARLLRPGGRLLVADFAPHSLEFLRERHGHRHLGIADRQMLGWTAQAGLEIESERTLAPAQPADPGRLTVRLWLARAPARSASPKAAVA